MAFHTFSRSLPALKVVSGCRNARRQRADIKGKVSLETEKPHLPRPLQQPAAPLTFLLLLLLLPILLTAAPAGAPAAKKPGPRKGQEVFDGPFPTFRIDIAPNELSKLRRENRAYVKATIREGTNVYQDVGLKLKGAAGSFRGVDQNPALTLNFDKFVTNQSFHGLDKIHLNNSVQDPSLLAEYISRDMFRAAGVPSTRVSNARVYFNNRHLGLYVMVEGFTKDFLRDGFGDASGNLYDGGFIHEITEPLEKDFGDDPNDRSDLRALAQAAGESDAGKRFERMAQHLDVDRFATYLAMEIILWDWDGYPLNRNNYRIYHDPVKDRLVFLPHGLDQMLWYPDNPWLPGMNGLVARAFVQTPEGRALYQEKMSHLLTNVVLLQTWTNKVLAQSAKITAACNEISRGLGSAVASQGKLFSDRLIQRVNSLHRQLATMPRPLQFDSTGAVALTGWQVRNDVTPGGVLEVVAGPDGKKSYYLRNRTGGGGVSYRMRVNLPPGPYVLEGQVKTRGVAPLGDERGQGGAAFRLSGNARRETMVGDAGWKTLGYPFVAPGGEVELICELKASRGEAWVAFDSIKLRKGEK